MVVTSLAQTHSKLLATSGNGSKPVLSVRVTSLLPFILFILILSHFNSSVCSTTSVPPPTTSFSVTFPVCPEPNPLPLISSVYLKMAALGGGLRDDLMDYGGNPDRWHTSPLCSALTEVWNKGRTVLKIPKSTWHPLSRPVLPGLEDSNPLTEQSSYWVTHFPFCPTWFCPLSFLNAAHFISDCHLRNRPISPHLSLPVLSSSSLVSLEVMSGGLVPPCLLLLALRLLSPHLLSRCPPLWRLNIKPPSPCLVLSCPLLYFILCHAVLKYETHFFFLIISSHAAFH